MPVPLGLGPDLTTYLQEMEDRLAKLETPQGPVAAYLTTSTTLSTVNAAQAGRKWVVLTDLKTAAYSNGSHWFRFDTGAQIV